MLEKLWRKSAINPAQKIDGRNVLCLVYNKHNRKDMLEKQRTFVTKINLATNPSTNLDPNINALTMHAFCNLWGNTYAMQMGFLNFRLVTESGIEIEVNEEQLAKVAVGISVKIEFDAKETVVRFLHN